MKRINLFLLLLLSTLSFAQSWQSKDVVRIENTESSFHYTFYDSTTLYIQKQNVSYIVSLPNSNYIQVGYLYEGATSKIMSCTYNTLTQPVLSSNSELVDTLNAWLNEPSSGGGGGGGSGTVTSVSVVTANGISGTVANATTTPAITLQVDTISKFATRKQLLDSIDRINTAINTKQETLISGTNIKTVNSNSILGSGNITVSGDSSSLSGLIAATSANTINNSEFTQEWQWDSLTSGNGLKLSSSSTGASGNSQSILLIEQTGINANTSQTTFGAIISNTKTGAASKSVALKLLNNGSGESLRMQSTASLVPNYLTYYNSSNALTAEIGHTYSVAPTFFYINSYLESIIFKVSNIERFRIGSDGINTSANYINVTSPNFISYSGTGRFYSTNGDEYSFQANNAGSSAFFGALSGNRGCLRTTGGQAIIWNNNQQVSINQNTVNASAQFQVDSGTRGVLFPRMTTTQKNAISSPAEGLEVYDLTLHQKSYYNGTTWINY